LTSGRGLVVPGQRGRPVPRHRTRPRLIRKGRLQPGRVFLADTAAGRLVEDEEVKAALAAEHPVRELACTPGSSYPGRPCLILSPPRAERFRTSPA